MPDSSPILDYQTPAKPESPLKTLRHQSARWALFVAYATFAAFFVLFILMWIVVIRDHVAPWQLPPEAWHGNHGPWRHETAREFVETLMFLPMLTFSLALVSVLCQPRRASLIVLLVSIVLFCTFSSLMFPFID